MPCNEASTEVTTRGIRSGTHHPRYAHFRTFAVRVRCLIQGAGEYATGVHPPRSSRGPFAPVYPVSPAPGPMIGPEWAQCLRSPALRVSGGRVQRAVRWIRRGCGGG
ncbi:hypothetical protein MTO96_021195 [Rhipicephalus appendiculatus]